MPIPKPKSSETRSDFISRCVSDENMIADYEDSGQRAAVCHATWNSAKKQINKEEMEYKRFSLDVKEYKKSDDENYGYFTGAMATTDRDRGDDVINAKAFDSTIEQYKQQKRNIKIYYNHNTSDLPIGIINPDSVKFSDGKWLVKGELNLEGNGSKVYSLMKQGALTDMSIGFSIVDAEYDAKNNTRLIKELYLWEVSVVGEPMNPQAKVTEVKKATTNILPLASRDRPWDSDAADSRVRQLTNSTDAPSAKYKQAFLWYDEENADNFGSYKLPYADVVDGKLTAIPRGIFAAAAALRGARGGVDIPQADKASVIAHVKRYYDLMGLDDPFSDDKSFKRFEIDEIENNITSKKDFENLLRESGGFSKKAAIYLASFINDEAFKQSESVESAKSQMAELLKEVVQLYKQIK